MVVKTELCAFSEFRIYPGHGIKFVRRDGQLVTMGSSKAKSMVHQRKKPSKLMWTQSWRRLNKKGKDDGVQRKRTRKVAKIQRAIVGVSLEEIRKKRAVVTPKVTATDAGAKEVKDKKKSKVVAPRGGASIPKNQKGASSAPAKNIGQKR